MLRDDERPLNRIDDSNWLIGLLLAVAGFTLLLFLYLLTTRP